MTGTSAFQSSTKDSNRRGAIGTGRVFLLLNLAMLEMQVNGDAIQHMCRLHAEYMRLGQTPKAS